MPEETIEVRVRVSGELAKDADEQTLAAMFGRDAARQVKKLIEVA